MKSDSKPEEARNELGASLRVQAAVKLPEDYGIGTQLPRSKGTKKAPTFGTIAKLGLPEDFWQSFKSCRGHQPSPQRSVAKAAAP